MEKPSEDCAKAFAGTFVPEGIEPSDLSTVPNGTGTMTSDSGRAADGVRPGRATFAAATSLKAPSDC
jgi:hypothetical protein